MTEINCESHNACRIKKPQDRALADDLLNGSPEPGENTPRIGISGPPGVGKSTFIEAIGQKIIEDNNRLAILAVDPSSTITGGSILGDKTRMDIQVKAMKHSIRPSHQVEILGA